MNVDILKQIPGGKRYNTVYPAAGNQDSSKGTADIINKIASTLKTNPNECFVLQGYSQGAAATVNAMPRITGASFNAVRAVFLVGDPNHHAGLASNIDQYGGTTTLNAIGVSDAFSVDIPHEWVSKTRDVCIKDDGVCNYTGGNWGTPQHLQYARDSATQRLGASFIVQRLK